MAKLIVGTKNRGKLQEMQSAVETGIQLVSIEDVYPDAPTPAETGSDYLENARIKARFYYDLVQQPILVDDGGLELVAFPDLLSVHTHEFFKSSQPEEQNQEILALFEAAPTASKEFILRATLVYFDGQEEVAVSKELAGKIYEATGDEGYGFDPILWIPEKQKTLGQLSLAERNALSPRIRGLKELLQRLEERNV